MALSFHEAIVARSRNAFSVRVAYPTAARRKGMAVTFTDQGWIHAGAHIERVVIVSATGHARVGSE